MNKRIILVLIFLSISFGNAQNNFIANPGAEEGNTSSWTTFGGGPAVESSTLQAHSGSYSFLNRNRTQFYHGPSTDIKPLVENGSLVSGERYTASVWVYHSEATTKRLLLNIKQVDGAGTEYQKLEDEVVPPNQWVEIVKHFVLKSDSSLQNLNFYVTSASGETFDFYSDDFFLGELEDYTPPNSSNPNMFIRANGKNLVVGASNRPILFKGMNVTVPADDDNTVEDIWDVKSVSLKDFKNIKRMGFNAIRLHLNYKIFEDDNNIGQYRKDGWHWLDRAIAYAKETGVYLLLDMHTPQGGYQSDDVQGTSKFWDGLGTAPNTSNQDRLINLWGAIADRYKHEPIILAYDLINEPRPNNSEEWLAYAEQLIAKIRTKDSNHMINLQTPFINGYTMRTVNDTNVMYDTHSYAIWGYSIQYSAHYGKDGKRWGAYSNSNPLYIDGNWDVVWTPEDGGTPPTNSKPFNKAWLQQLYVDEILEFTNTHNVPVNIGEFGSVIETFDHDVGALELTSDTYAIFDGDNSYGTKINSFYFDYHGSSFGLYGNWNGFQVDELDVNVELKAFFQSLNNDANSSNFKPLQRTGWNLMSVCQDIYAIDINMSGIEEIQNQDGLSIYTGEYSNYSNLVVLEAGYAYWVKGEAGALFDGKKTDSNLSKPLLRDGWNLMATCQDTSKEDIDMSAYHEIQAQNGQTIYTGDGANYSNLDTLLNGYGYWVKGSSGTLFHAYRENEVKILYTINPIKVDQFGYLPKSTKIAVLSNPIEGFNTGETFIPSNNYEIRRVSDNTVAWNGGVVTSWKNGATHSSSGDQLWHYDFSAFEEEGEYYIYDKDNKQSSYPFQIASTVYDDVLKQSVRMLYLQRSNFAKIAPYVEEPFIDGKAFPQDEIATSILDKTNPATQKDVSGGWFDAGDYNKYINYTDEIVHDLLIAYTMHPTFWGDDYTIPESGNGVPDILDELRYELEWVLKMQVNSDDVDGSNPTFTAADRGSFLHKASALHFGQGNESPPSSNTDARYYAPPTVSATISAVGMLAHAAIIYESIDNNFTQKLKDAAVEGWNYLEGKAYSNYSNNGFGTAEAEDSIAIQKTNKIVAAIYLYALTNNVTYKNYYETNAIDGQLINHANLNDKDKAYFNSSGTKLRSHDAQLFYTTLAGAESTFAEAIKKNYTFAQTNQWVDFAPLKEYDNETNPYFAFLDAYPWGSNQAVGSSGNMLMNMLSYDMDSTNHQKYLKASVGYLHYLHGVNPQNLVYLSNMNAYGSEKSVDQMHHAWFIEGMEVASGFLVGGAIDSYSGNAMIYSENVSNQPPLKAYASDYDSYEMSEPQLMYQSAYIRLLSSIMAQ
ncbi:glycoside hydrolase family 9 protein [bacterium]|nr:glycoside hydrolase family 9 protein [bacterium]MBU1958339.1 glycoside hydrolase family 9 protein [bacterium]